MDANNSEWQAPLPPADFKPDEENPGMSLAQTLTGIFFEPSEVFEDLRRNPFPRLIFPLLLCSLLIVAFSFALNYKIGAERIVKEQLSSRFAESVPDEVKRKMIDDAKNVTPARQFVQSSLGGAVYIVIFAIMGLIYWGLCSAFGGSGKFFHGVAVAAYSSFPPMLIAMLGSLIILYFKSADDISFFQSQQGLLKLNPTMFLDAKGVLGAVIARFDLLALWGMFLASVGMQKTFRVSSGVAWGISILFWLIGTAVAALGGLFAPS